MDNTKNVSTDSETKLNETRINRSKLYTDYVATAAVTIGTIHHDDLDLVTVLKEVSKGISKINSGDITDIETMLMTQAQTLNIFFHRMLSQVPHIEMINQIQLFSEIALRAQNQARKTLAALAEIKHPRRATFIKQQNNAINQQVNNQPNNSNKIENIKNPEKIANELLSEVPHEKMDIGEAGKTIPNHTPSEAMAKIHRTAVTGR